MQWFDASLIGLPVRAVKMSGNSCARSATEFQSIAGLSASFDFGFPVAPFLMKTFSQTRTEHHLSEYNRPPSTSCLRAHCKQSVRLCACASVGNRPLLRVKAPCKLCCFSIGPGEIFIAVFPIPRLLLLLIAIPRCQNLPAIRHVVSHLGKALNRSCFHHNRQRQDPSHSGHT
jgi:hypothetical protein